MSLHGRCVTQHPDSLRKITSVLGREKQPLPEVLDFPLCYLPSVGDFSCGQHGCRVPAICPQTDLLAAIQPALVHTLAFSTSFSVFCFSPSPPHSGFVPAFLTVYLIPSVSIPAFTLHLLFFPPSCSLSVPCYLSLCQGANVGLQMKQLDFHLRLPKIDMCCSVSGRTLSASPTLSRGRTGRQMKQPQLLTRKHGTQAAITQLFIAHIYYIA